MRGNINKTNIALTINLDDNYLKNTRVHKKLWKKDDVTIFTNSFYI